MERYANGQLKHEILRNDIGQLHGIQRGYYENGRVYYEDPYHLGLIHGIARWYWDDGELEKEEYFLEGRQVSQEEYEVRK